MSFFGTSKPNLSHTPATSHVHVDGGTTLDYNYIDEGIYIGTNQCCTIGLAEVLKKEDISTDISLEQDKLDAPYGVSQYVWIPTPDHSIPSEEQLGFFVQALKELVATKQKIYVHCKNGHGRSSTFLSAYLIATRGLTQEQALSFIQEHRPGAHMQDVQIDFVRKYQMRLRAS